ncbi:MAG: DNA-binding CsgD family transcriptional regulator [Dinoroseobacter sp.]|jgi:DNA-binding CsgD family transcriptional regulator
MKDLVTSILNSATVPSNWESALDQFNAEIGFASSCMFSVHEFETSRMNFTWSKFLRENAPAEVIAKIERGDDPEDAPGYQFLLNNPAQTLYDELTLFGVKSEAELPKSNVRNLVAELGLGLRVAGALNRHGPWLDGLFCQTRPGDDVHALANDPRTELLLPIMSSTVVLGRMLATLTAQFQAALGALDALGLGVFLINGRGTVLTHNREADRIIAQADGLTFSKARTLVMRNEDSAAEFKMMIERANGLFSGDLDPLHPTLALARPSGAYEYLVSVQPLADAVGELQPGLSCAFVTVIDPARRDALSADGLATLGDLTETERAVVELLIQGFRPAEVAELRDVSRNTIKTQVQSISQKLRCNGQSHIIRVAAATRLPISKLR